MTVDVWQEQEEQEIKSRAVSRRGQDGDPAASRFSRPIPGRPVPSRPARRRLSWLSSGLLMVLTACGAATPPAGGALASTLAAPSVMAALVPAQQPGLSLPQETQTVFHKHSAALPATFRGLRGRVNLRLVPPDGYRSGLRLTTSALVLGGGSSTRMLVISAPGLPEFFRPDASLSATYTLVVSQGGRDVASAPVTIEEKLLSLRITTAPAEVSARSGDTVRFTVSVEVTPPLDAPEPIELRGGCPVEGCAFQATPVSATSGDGRIMTREFQMTVPRDLTPPPGYAYPLHYSVETGDFAGYRMPWYGDSRTTLTWRRLE